MPNKKFKWSKNLISTNGGKMRFKLRAVTPKKGRKSSGKSKSRRSVL